MSSIQEALRKAKRERQARDGRSGTLSSLAWAPKAKRSRRAGRPFSLFGLGCAALLLAIGTVWLAGSQLGRNGQDARNEGRGPVALPMPANVSLIDKHSSNMGRESPHRQVRGLQRTGGVPKSPSAPRFPKRKGASDAPAGQKMAAERPKKSVYKRPTRTPSSVRLLLLNAQRRRREGDLEGSEKLFKEALKRDPRSVEALVDLANLYLEALGRPQQALSLYKRALSVDPNRASIYVNLGVYYMDKGQWSLAGYHLEKAARLDPSMAEVPYNMACMEARRGNLKEAARQLRKAISLNPQCELWAQTDPDLAALRGKRASISRKSDGQPSKPQPNRPLNGRLP